MLSENKWFYFVGGRKASSINELKKILENTEEAEFRYHVNNKKNDFANWVEDIFKAKKLAHTMREVSERDGLLIILDDFLKKKHHKAEHRKKIKKLAIPQEKRADLEKGKELSEKEIKSIVEEAKQVLAEQEEHKAKGTGPPTHEHHLFVVKDFIYGFILGIVFGLIIMWIIFNLFNFRF